MTVRHGLRWGTAYGGGSTAYGGWRRLRESRKRLRTCSVLSCLALPRRGAATVAALAGIDAGLKRQHRQQNAAPNTARPMESPLHERRSGPAGHAAMWLEEEQRSRRVHAARSGPSGSPWWIAEAWTRACCGRFQSATARTLRSAARARRLVPLSVPVLISTRTYTHCTLPRRLGVVRPTYRSHVHLRLHEPVRRLGGRGRPGRRWRL